MKKIFSIAKILFVLIFLVSTVLISFQPYREAQATDDSQTLSVTVQDTITITVDETSALGNLTPGTPVYDDSTVTVATNSVDGWSLKLVRDIAAQTMLDATDTYAFPDATTWDPTASSGDGNASLTPGANLSFRVKQAGTDVALYNSTWWGAGDTESTQAKYAGTVPTASATIATMSAYDATDQIVILRYRADAPATQRALAYDGGVTLTALVTP